MKADSQFLKGPLDPRTVVSFHHVELAYGRTKALDDVSFNLANGEFVCLTGPSGAGKSSILRLITMDAFPTSGQIIVRGMISTRMNRRLIPRLRREIGFVFQDFRLLEDRSVYDNVAFAQLVVGVPGAEIKRNVTRALTQVGLWSKREQRPQTLSGGEQQRVAIARAHRQQSRRSCSPTNRPATSTRRWPRRSWTCCSGSTRPAPASCSALTTTRSSRPSASACW